VSTRDPVHQQGEFLRGEAIDDGHCLCKPKVSRVGREQREKRKEQRAKVREQR
jgi:hypothetical protein